METSKKCEWCASSPDAGAVGGSLHQASAHPPCPPGVGTAAGRWRWAGVLAERRCRA